MFDSLLNKYRDIQAKREDGEGGFTLIELLVVVVIIGILIAIAIPLYLNYTKGAKNTGAQADVRDTVAAVQQCYNENGNALPGAPTGNGTISTNLVFSCTSGGQTVTETATVSENNTLTYAASGGSYTVTGISKDSDSTYKFDSSTGKITKTVASGS